MISPKYICRLIRKSWAFIAYDFTVTVILGLEWSLSAWYVGKAEYRHSSLAFAQTMLKSFIYFWFYALAHCTQNQIFGLEEDILNKPNRPLPKKLCSMEEAIFLRNFSIIAFLFLGDQFGTLPEAALWLLTVHVMGLYCGYWWVKNLYCVVGYYALLSAAWKFSGQPVTGVGHWWMVMIPLLTFILIPVQDLRDIEGDSKIGRRTLPILIGAFKTRMYLLFAFGIAAPIVLYSLLAVSYWGTVCWVVNTVISLMLAYRTVFLTTKEADHDTYLWYVLWMGLIELNAITVL